MKVSDFRFKGLKRLNEWEVNLLIYQRLCNNFEYQLFDQTKIADVWDEVMGDLYSIDLSKVNQQDLYEETLRTFGRAGGGAMGEFYTPPCIKAMYNRIAECYEDYPNGQRVYDPTCGTGGLLLSIPNKQSYTGIEIRREVSCLADMYVRHMLPNADVAIGCADALQYDFPEEDKQDIVVANPPYGIRWEPRPGLDYNGVYPPARRADGAFIKHMIDSIHDRGIVLCLCYPTIFHRRGSEEKIRQGLIARNGIEAVIHLPENLFRFTSTPTTLVVIRKCRFFDDILMADFTGCDVKAKPRGREIPESCVDDFIELYKAWMRGEQLPEPSHARRRIGLVNVKVIHPEDIMDGVNLHPPAHMKLPPPEEKPYNPEVQDPAIALMYLYKIKLTLDLESGYRDVRTNPVRELLVNELKPVVDGIFAQNTPLFADVMRIYREYTKEDEE